MTGFDGLGTHELIGFDFEALLKGAAGMMQGSGGKEDAAAAEKRRLEDEKRQAQQSASRLKKIAIALGVVAGVGGIAAFLLGRKR